MNRSPGILDLLMRDHIITGNKLLLEKWDTCASEEDDIWTRLRRVYRKEIKIPQVIHNRSQK
jgi:hypothetical protein